MTKFKLLQIDAWREEGQWTWNGNYPLEDGLFIDDSLLTTRGILKALREWGYLTEASKGKLTVEDVACGDYCFEIQLRGTKEPILALSAIH